MHRLARRTASMNGLSLLALVATAVSIVRLVVGVLVFQGAVRATLFDVVAANPLVLTVSAAEIVVVALAAALIPALRAGRVDVREALIGE